MKNRNNTTISSIYLEPEGTIFGINEVALESDIIGGDLNKAESGLHTKGVFHFKNIRIIDELDLKNRDILDHPILIGETDFATWKIPEKEKIIILKKEKVLINNEQINELSKNKTLKIKFINPHKQIEIQLYEEKLNIEKFSEDYLKLKEETKIKQKEEYIRRYQNINTILTLTQGIMPQENWMKINKILIKNNKSKIWKETANKNRITEDFKKLYKHSEIEKKWEINKIAEIIKEIVVIIQENIEKYNKDDKLFTPFSKAKDFNGFSQKIIINSLKGDNIEQEIIN